MYGTFKGGPNLQKSLFVYRVNKDPVTDVIRDYVPDQGIVVLEIRLMSYKDSLSKSLKLTVSNKDYTKLFQEENVANWSPFAHSYLLVMN